LKEKSEDLQGFRAGHLQTLSIVLKENNVGNAYLEQVIRKLENGKIEIISG
jgi:hypothetical protein